MARTPLQLLAEERLGSSLDDYVTARRQQGFTWRAIARDLRRDTRLQLTHVSLHNWYARMDRAAGNSGDAA